MKKPYTKNKKKTKNDEWTTSGVGLPRAVAVRLRKETQLDRIERKLDELLTRPYSAPASIPWNGPWQPSPWFSQPPRTPVDPYGNPTIYCSSNGGAR